MADDQLLLVTRLCEQFFCTKNTFLTVSVIRKLAIIKKQEYLIRAHCVRHVKYVMQRMSRDRLLQSITADSLLAPVVYDGSITNLWTDNFARRVDTQTITKYHNGENFL